MDEQPVTLSIEQVSKRFDEFVAVSDLSLSVRRGRIFGLIGPNGAGKTTTIRMIVGITAPDTGRITLFGEALTPELRDRIGYLPEERGLYKRMKVSEQLRFFGVLKGMEASAADESAGAWLARLKLAEWGNKKTDELSKGMQQKIQFIAAVLHDPELLILDEVFSGLDPVNAEALTEVLLDLKGRGKTIIFSTHMMEQAEKLCDDICLINRSRKVLDGSLREVKRSFGRRSVILRAETFNGGLQNSPLVANVKSFGDHEEVLLREGVDAQQLLKALIAGGARITRFEETELSLRDIFLRKVGEAA